MNRILNNNNLTHKSRLSALTSGALFMIIMAQEIRTPVLDTKNHWRNTHMGEGIFISDSHFRDEKLTYPKAENM
ncbi:MAG: hypothetical protein ACRD5B_10510 [Nitrososphaeraceae archaeon]